MPAKLTVVRGKRVGAEFALDGKAVFDLGSASTAVLRFDEPGVAANHCRIFREEKKFTIFDLCGLGVTVNGQRVARSALKSGDEIGVGQIKLRFEDGPPVSGGAGGEPVVAGQVNASLVCIEGADKGKSWPLSPGKTSFMVGRGMTAEIVVLDIKCSREHCKIEQRSDGYYLVDLGKENGTKLNGRKVGKSSATKLSPGDQLKLGYSIITFRLEGDLPPLPETTKMTGATDGLVPQAKQVSGGSSRSPAVASGHLPPTARMQTPVPPPAPADVDVDFDFGDAPAEAPAAQHVQAADPAADPEEAAEASLRTFVFDEQPAFEPVPVAPPEKSDKGKKSSVDRLSQTDKDGTGRQEPTQDGDFFFGDEAGKADAAPPPPPKKTIRADEGEDAAVRTFVFDDTDFEEKAAPPPPPPMPAPKPAPPPMPTRAEVPAPPPPKKQAMPEGEDAALRTFVFDDADFEEKAAPPPPPPSVPPPPKPAPPPSKAAAKAEAPAPPPPPKKQAMPEGEDAALRTFVFDDADFEEKAAPPPPSAPPPPKPAPPPPPKPAPPSPKPAAKVEAPAPPPPKKQAMPEGEDAAGRTFVFDDDADFDEKPAPPPPQAAPPPPPPKPMPAPAKPTAKVEAPAPPPPKKQAMPEGEDAAGRTFVFDDDDADFDEKPAPPPKPAPKGAAPPPPPPKAPERTTHKLDKTDVDDKDTDEQEETRDPALRTFVFDEAPAFEDAPPPPPAPPPPKPRPAGTTAKYSPKDEDDEDESSDAALRTFVFDEAPTFDPSESSEKASLRRVDVDVPDLDAPPKTPPPPSSRSVVPATPATPAKKKKKGDDDDEERPPEFQTQFMMGAPTIEDEPQGKSQKTPPVEDDDEDGEQFHTMVFDKPPEF